MVRREPRSSAFEFPTPKGLIANRIHCPATLLNGERRHSSGGMSRRTIRGLNYERRAEGALCPRGESPRFGGQTRRRGLKSFVQPVNYYFRRDNSAGLESNCDAHATCIILPESGTGARPDLPRPRGVLRTAS